MNLIVGIFFVMIIISFNSSQSYWVNHPYKCMETNEDSNLISYMCNPEELSYNFHRLNTKLNTHAIGRICVPNPGNSLSIKGKYCIRVTKTTSCFMDELFNKKLTYKTSYSYPSFARCREAIITNDIETPFYPPPRCTPNRNITERNEFFVFHDIELNDHVGEQKGGMPLFEIDGRTYKESIHSSEFCQLRNWDCFEYEPGFELDSGKLGSWKTIQYIIGKLNLLYFKEFGLVEENGICRLKICGHWCLRTVDDQIFHFESVDLLDKIPDCPKVSTISLQPIRRPGIEVSLMALLQSRDKICKDIKLSLINKRKLDWNKLRYLTPLIPGPGIGYNFKKYWTTSTTVLSGKAVEGKELAFYMCDYWPTEIVPNSANLSEIYIRKLGSEKFTKFNYDGPLIQEKTSRKYGDSEIDVLSYHGINGFLQTQNSTSYPFSQVMDLIYGYKSRSTPYYIEMKSNNSQKLNDSFSHYVHMDQEHVFPLEENVTVLPTPILPNKTREDVTIEDRFLEDIWIWILGIIATGVIIGILLWRISKL
nr:nonstructural glycoprotein [Yata virus]